MVLDLVVGGLHNTILFTSSETTEPTEFKCSIKWLLQTEMGPMVLVLTYQIDGASVPLISKKS